MAKGAKKKRIIEAEGIAHIQATFNNTLVAISDLAGNIVAGGRLGRAVSRAPRSRRRSPRRSPPRTPPRRR
jgi:ribosomal protein S11